MKTKRDSDIVYEKIKEKIITAKLAPGEIIVESKLMEEFEMGRTPIREALNRLSYENQVRIIPRQCILVTEQPTRDLDAIFEMRYNLSILEGELVARRRTKDELEELRNIVEELKNEDDAERRVMLDRKFHNYISKATKNSFLESTMSNMLDLSIRLIFLNKENLENIDTHLVEEHIKIVDSIEKMDEHKTSNLLQKHVVSFRNKFMR